MKRCVHAYSKAYIHTSQLLYQDSTDILSTQYIIHSHLFPIFSLYFVLYSCMRSCQISSGLPVVYYNSVWSQLRRKYSIQRKTH